MSGEKSTSERTLRIAAENGDLVGMRSLLDKGIHVDSEDDRGSTPLYKASTFNRASIIKELLARGANVNHQNMDGNTPLIVACFAGSAEATKLLLNAGADINLKDNNGKTALDVACQRSRGASGRPECAEAIEDWQNLSAAEREAQARWEEREAMWDTADWL